MTFTIDKSTWTRVKLGDVVRNVNESVKDPVSIGIDRTIGLEHIESGNFEVQDYGTLDEGVSFTRRVRPGQVLFGKRRAYLRKVAVASFDAVCSGDILVFEPKDERLDARFLPFLVSSDDFFDTALQTSAGSMSPRTSWKALAAYEFLLPPIEEQHRIADLLWHFEGHRRKLDQLEKESSTTIQGVIDMFLTSCSLGALSNLCKLEASLLSPNTEGFMTLPHVGIDRIDPLSGALETSHTAGEDRIKSGKYYFRKGDVLYSKIRPNLRKVGIACRDGLCSADCYPLTPLVGISPELLRAVLLSKSVYERAVALSIRTAMPKLNRKQLFSIPVPVPDEATSENIENLVSRQRVLASRTDQELLKVKKMRQSLLSEVFGGSDVH